jgi:hypothetical protein
MKQTTENSNRFLRSQFEWIFMKFGHKVQTCIPSVGKKIPDQVLGSKVILPKVFQARWIAS